MPQRLADRPLAAARVGVPGRIREGDQQAPEVPAGGRRRSDPIGRTTTLLTGPPNGGFGVDRGELERLGDPVETVPKLLLAPRPSTPKAP